jgi:hypothetical protein
MKYSIIINNITDNLYAVVLKSWELDKDGNQINVNSLTKSGISLNDALIVTTKYLKQNG